MKPRIHLFIMILAGCVWFSDAGIRSVDAQESVVESEVAPAELTESTVVSPALSYPGYSEWVWRGIGRRGHWVCTCDASTCGHIATCPPFCGCLFKRRVRVESLPQSFRFGCGYCEWRNGIKINSTCTPECSCDYRFVKFTAPAGPGIIEVTWCTPTM